MISPFSIVGNGGVYANNTGAVVALRSRNSCPDNCLRSRSLDLFVRFTGGVSSIGPNPNLSVRGWKSSPLAIHCDTPERKRRKQTTGTVMRRINLLGIVIRCNQPIGNLANNEDVYAIRLSLNLSKRVDLADPIVAIIAASSHRNE